MLAQANLWSDIIGVILILVAAFIPVYFFGMNLVTGRLKERFIDKHWHLLEVLHEPWEEEHPMPIRIWHWINLCGFVIFFASGFYIRYPYFSGGREIMRYLHYVAMYAVVGAFTYRMIFMFTSGDWKNFTYNRKDLPVVIQVTLYYVGLRSEYPHIKKYHPIQRGSYIAIYALLPIQALTGFALIWPTVLLAPFAGLFGGVAHVAAWTRLAHSIIMRIFLVLVATHGPLAIYEGYPAFKHFWFGIETPLPNVHADGKHGH